MGEIAYMKAQEAILRNSISHVEEANFVNNRGYVFRPYNNLPTHYHTGLRNYKNLSYGNQAIVPYVPYQLSVSNAPLDFQGQGALSSNYQGQRRHPIFEESVLHLLNGMKKNNDNRIANLETNQGNMGASLKNLETQVGQLTHSMKESSSRSFLSDMEKNSKDFLSITLRSGKELGNSKKVENEKVVNGKIEMRMWQSRNKK